MLTPGEGAVSTGAMVPVFAARDPGSATQVVAILEAHAIPAILDSEISVAAGWARAGQRPRVLVPSTMLPAAKAILLEHTAPADATEVSAVASWTPAKVDSTPVPTASSARSAIPAVTGAAVPAPVPADLDGFAPFDDDEADEGPIAERLPEPGPVGPRLTIALACIAFGLVFQRVAELLLSERGATRAFGASLEVVDAPWRLITAGFMHGGYSHMVSNGLFGLLIGVVLFGTHRVGATALVWLVSSVFGILAELAVSRDVTVIGASAGNYGLMGLWAFGQLERARRAPLPSRERIKTLGVLLLLVPGALTPFSSTGTRIAVFAHAMGFAFGFMLGRTFARRLDDDTPRIDRRSRAAGALAGALVVAAFGAALITTFV